MSDTPKTDEELAELGFGFYTMGGFPADAVKVEFARKLERERDDLREIFPKILEALESGACASTCSVDFLREIPREVMLVRQRLERERDVAREAAKNLSVALTAAIRSANVRQDEAEQAMAERDEWKQVAEGSLLGAIHERDEAVRSCHIWQQGHSKIVADRDHWRAEAERWRDFHHEIIADRDWLILELVEISSTADNCESTWDGLHKIAVIADNILNGRELP